VIIVSEGATMANPRTIAPVNPYPERGYPNYEAKVASGAVGERGPLRFEEGLATDPDETMQQRLHAGSASWIEAPTMLGEFATGSGDGDNDPFFPLVGNPGVRQQRISPTVIQ
jgi:hypothetical protein